MDLSSFDFGTTRLSLRAVLISSLLVLAHVLLTTVASSRRSTLLPYLVSTINTPSPRASPPSLYTDHP